MNKNHKNTSNLNLFLDLSSVYTRDITAPSNKLIKSNSDEIKQLKSNICKSIVLSANGLKKGQLFRIRKSLEILYHLNKASDKQYLILRTIENSIIDLKFHRDLNSKLEWMDAIKYAVEIINLSDHRESIGENTREKIVADSVRKLNRKGYKIVYTDEGPLLDKPSYNQLCKEINKKIKRVGGLVAANKLLSLMQQSARIIDGSLIHARTTGITFGTVSEAGIPWHYLFSLCLKNLHTPTSRSEIDSIFQAAIDLSTLLASVMDVEPQNSFENLTIEESRLSQTLTETLIYDELFALPQWQPQIAASVMESWINALDKAGCTFPKAPKQKWQLFAKQIFQLSRTSELVPIKINTITKIGLLEKDVQLIFNECISPEGGLNEKYLTPQDTKKRNGNYFPIIRGEKQGTFLQPTALISRSLGERLFTLMRDENDQELGNKMGTALEQLTYDILDKSDLNINIFNGKYANPEGGSDLEIDIVGETDERIYIFECKKKSLINDSRAGETLAIFKDLNDGFFKSTLQLARHEFALRSQDKIHFRDGKVLSLNGRKIEKFGINLFDHGSLQHRDQTLELIRLMTGASVNFGNFDNKSTANVLTNALNKNLSNIAATFKKLTELQNGTDAKLFNDFKMSTWWLSIDQLAYAIHKGDKSLWNGLKHTRHLTYRSGDVIYEINKLVQINQQLTAMYELNKKQNNRTVLQCPQPI